METWIIFCLIGGVIIVLLMLTVGALEFVTWIRLQKMKREYGESLTESYSNERKPIVREDSLRTYFERSKERGVERKNEGNQETAEADREDAGDECKTPAQIPSGEELLDE